MTTLQSFTPDEKDILKKILATKVASMMGRKFEEDDWSSCYCRAKGLPAQQWSNLNIDIMCNGLGVEHKMLCVNPKRSLLEYAGTSLMHPSATRSIRISSTDVEPNSAMVDIFSQYNDLIELRKQTVLKESGCSTADMRTGWLLWERSLTEFLYFEERMYSPDPNNYYAEWNERSARGARKASKNLWIYEKKTGKKRFSVTTVAGAKIQPYFDIPSPTDTNLVFLRVQGEVLDGGLVVIWLTPSTVRELKRLLGGVETLKLSDAILALDSETEVSGAPCSEEEPLAIPVKLTLEAYSKLVSVLGGVSDEHRAQLLVQRLREDK